MWCPRPPRNGPKPGGEAGTCSAGVAAGVAVCASGRSKITFHSNPTEPSLNTSTCPHCCAAFVDTLRRIVMLSSAARRMASLVSAGGVYSARVPGARIGPAQASALSLDCSHSTTICRVEGWMGGVEEMGRGVG